VNAGSQVILVLQLLLNLGPVALYFLILGLANSQRSPRLVSARADFIALAIVFLPVLVWPVPMMVAAGWTWALVPVGVIVGGVFLALLPRADAGWVVYHATRSQAAQMIERALGRLGWTSVPHGGGAVWCVPEARLRLRITAFSWLGSVSVHVAPSVGSTVPRAAISRLGAELERELNRHELLPSPVGPCLVLVAIVLWAVPVWMMFRHIDAIVDVVQEILFA
jgi:hypothetical protein